MGLFTKKIGPVFLKDSSSAEEYIGKLKELSEKATGKLKKDIENDIKYASYGLAGEKSIAYELRNSGIDMYILHDICIGDGDPAQIDYFVVTRKHCYVIECKNLYGNIRIDRDVFSRELDHGKRESIYSPVTQNQRHLEKLKEVRLNSKSNLLTKKLFESNFDKRYKSIVVLANPKTVLNDRYAYKEIKDQVIRCDQLVKYLKDREVDSKETEMSQKEMEELANYFLTNSREDRSDYTKKYQERLDALDENSAEPVYVKLEQKSVQKPESERMQESEPEQKPIPQAMQKSECKPETMQQPKTASEPMQESAPIPEQAAASDNRDELVKALKKFRMDCSKQEDIPPYYVFKDATLEQLVREKPVSREELLKISGFGEKKVEKYGDSIIAIISSKS